MILRNVSVRFGRKAVAALIPRPAPRALSTNSYHTTPTATTTASGEEARSSSSDSSQRSLRAETFFRPSRAPPVRAPGKHTPTVPLEQVKADWIERRHVQKQTGSLGSAVEKRYMPRHLLDTLPTADTVSLELLMASQAHMGHNTSLWNPGNSRYVYGVRQGIHIIALETTLAHLRRAARVVEEVAYHGGLVLFVGTRSGQMEIVTTAAQLAGACHLFTKWTPGTITNRDQILAGVPMKVVNERDEELEGFDAHVGNCRPLVPDLVVCLNPLENYPMLHECALASVPTIGIIDTDADPTMVTYTIPANDDSLRAVSIIAGVLGNSGKRGQARRRYDAEHGIVTWENPADIKKFIRLELERQAANPEPAEEKVQKQPVRSEGSMGESGQADVQFAEHPLGPSVTGGAPSV